MLERRRILLEICPTSNVHTGAVVGIARHPVRRLYDRGVPIAIGDDDPVTSRTSTSRELTLLQERFGFTRKELAGIQKTTLEASFLADSDLRTRLLATLSGGIDKAGA
jgi:adenosine deaminase